MACPDDGHQVLVDNTTGLQVKLPPPHTIYMQVNTDLYVNSEYGLPLHSIDVTHRL